MNPAVRLVLASSSPRRALLLSLAGVVFTTSHPEVDEAVLDGEEPGEYVLRLSQEKANTVERGDGQVVLAADTIVVLDGEILGKPADLQEAAAMVGTLAGRTHSVLTGWTILGDDSHRFGVEESLVSFHPRTSDEIADYVERTEPLDKAGGYAIQGDNGWLIERVVGSRSNVMGLPVKEVIDALESIGIGRSTP